ncbi:MAG TPA: methyltransferase domain-containing protein [Actinomycetota bacterium]|nr:methyltransferase domain-containing protein [Actinomycetota bacterium]
MPRERAKKIVSAIYSAAAERIYEPVVVNGAFRLFGGNLNELALEQGRRAVAVAGGGAILDMPVGTAHFTIPLAHAHDGLVVGVDIAEGMVRAARAAARRAGAEQLSVVQADAHHLPFGDGTFAAVMCTNGLQVIPGLDRALGELARVIRPGGMLFVSVLTLPLGSALPRGTRSNLPAMLRSGSGIAAAVAATGLEVTEVRSERLATLIEAKRT